MKSLRSSRKAKQKDFLSKFRKIIISACKNLRKIVAIYPSSIRRLDFKLIQIYIFKHLRIIHNLLFTQFFCTFFTKSVHITICTKTFINNKSHFYDLMKQTREKVEGIKTTSLSCKREEKVVGSDKQFVIFLFYFETV